MKILYGILENNIDITHLALEKCMDNNILCIPRGDHDRACLFSDPLPGTMKSIFIEYNNSEEINIDSNYPLKISYGIRENNIDITHLAFEKCMNHNILHIPRGDADRACLFSDPLPGTLKVIFIEYNNTQEINIIVDCSVSSLKILYGTRENNIDITNIALEKCMNNNIIFIPRGDHNRSFLFSDPAQGSIKSIFLKTNVGIQEYDLTQEIYINTQTFQIFTHLDVPYSVQDTFSHHQFSAIIIEPRQHNALHFVLKNFLENLSHNWTIIIFHGNQNVAFINNIVENHLNYYKFRIKLVHLPIDNLTGHEYSQILKSNPFYDYIETEMFLVFQTDTYIFKQHKALINEFMDYDYVGAPWSDGTVGNGGLSLRRKSKMLEIIQNIPDPGYEIHEDTYFSALNKSNYSKPSFEKAKEFSVETVFNTISFGMHNAWRYIKEEEWNFLVNKCPDLETLRSLQ